MVIGDAVENGPDGCRRSEKEGAGDAIDSDVPIRGHRRIIRRACVDCVGHVLADGRHVFLDPRVCAIR